jgi:hypothetical protein
VGKRRKVLGLGAVGVVVAAVVVIVIATNGGSSNAGAQGSSAPSGSATVERRDLIATDTESGTLSYADPQTVFNRVSGTITWLPAVGQVIHAGHALYDVDDAPVVLFDGSTPAFRDLSPSVSDGPDVLELNRDLLAMGFAAPGSITPDDVWQAGTTAAVERWQASLGETETGTITLGQIVFLPGSQRITALDTVVGSTGSGGGGNGSGNGNGSASGAGTSVTPRPEFVSLTTTTPTSVAGASGPGPPSGKHHEKKKRDPEAALLKAMAALLKAEQAQLKAARAGNSASGGHSPGPGKSGGGGGGSGGSGSGSGASGGSGAGGGASATAIMSTSSTKLIVTVDLDASKQAEAVVGAPVMVELPTGRTVNGKVAAVSPVAQSSSGGNSGNGGGGGGNGGSGSGATIPVTITVPGRLPSRGLDQAAVSVNFEQQVQRNVLSVPVTALLATQGGGYAVQEALAPHRLIPVTPGLFAAGYVQISGAGVYPGLEITDSQG